MSADSEFTISLGAAVAAHKPTGLVVTFHRGRAPPYAWEPFSFSGTPVEGMSRRQALRLVRQAESEFNRIAAERWRGVPRSRAAPANGNA
ncbi:MAG TPA: hypothetical protein VKY65_14395 [Alphaproteobacteria bacterium]|nr:hypothetical protein [Alphaproteobacteria bacterium]